MIDNHVDDILAAEATAPLERIVDLVMCCGWGQQIGEKRSSATFWGFFLVCFI